MGSIGAWFAGYLKKDERSNNSTRRDHLLDVLALGLANFIGVLAARTAASV